MRVSKKRIDAHVGGVVYLRMERTSRFQTPQASWCQFPAVVLGTRGFPAIPGRAKAWFQVGVALLKEKRGGGFDLGEPGWIDSKFILAMGPKLEEPK